MSGGVTRLHVVRHGNTFSPGETPLRVGVRTDIPLVASGIAQGQALGRAFAAAGIVFDRAIASPLRRTQETAALILAAQPAPIAIEAADWLAEIDHGPDEAQTDAAIVARIGKAALAAWDAEAIVPPGWVADVPQRIAAWQALYAGVAGRGGDMLIVTSNGSARFALMADPALLRQAQALRSLKIRTGAGGTIAVDAAGAATLIDWDRRPDGPFVDTM